MWVAGSGWTTRGRDGSIWTPWRLVLEPGRFLAADTAWYAAEVIDLKRTHGRDFVVLRGGTHHFRLPAAWGYSHPAVVRPTEHWDYPWRRDELTDATVDVVGELCTPRDVLCRDLRVERVRIGDILVFGRTGAYGWDISHHDFLSHAHPEHRVVA
jgi:diaminopimelate decarboxylase